MLYLIQSIRGGMYRHVLKLDELRPTTLLVHRKGCHHFGREAHFSIPRVQLVLDIRRAKGLYSKISSILFYRVSLNKYYQYIMCLA